MDELINFINEYYIWIIVVIAVLIMALIGYLIDSNVKYHKNKKNQDKDDNGVHDENNVAPVNVDAQQNNMGIAEPVMNNATLVSDLNTVSSFDNVAPVNVDAQQNGMGIAEPVANNATPVSDLNTVPSFDNVAPVNVDAQQNNMGIAEPVVNNATLVADLNTVPSFDNVASVNVDAQQNNVSAVESVVDNKTPIETTSIHNNDVVKSVEEILASSNNSISDTTNVQNELEINNNASISTPKIDEINIDNKESSDENDIWKF